MKTQCSGACLCHPSLSTFPRAPGILSGLLFFVLFLPHPIHAKSPIKVSQVTITAYHQNGQTASGAKAAQGCIALSRDLEQKYRVKFGDTIIVKNVGRFTFKDRLPKKWKKRADIYVASLQKAKAFGKKRQTITIVKNSPTRPRQTLLARKYS